MALISAQALHLRPLSLPTSSFSSSPLSVQSPYPPLKPLRPPPHSISTIYAPKSARQVTRRRFFSKATVSDYNPSIADILSDVSIFTAAGELVKFEDLWDQNEGIAVVALLRHFGCPCCWELASTLKESKARFDSAGVKLVAVGVGAPNKARILAERLPFPMDCLYADPNRKAYDVLSLYHGFSRTFFNPASAKVLSRLDALRNAVKNYTIEATPDDRSGVLQQGGMFIFKGKQLLYAWKDKGTGDHAPLSDIFDICCKVPVS
ncbi:hypothetical protein FNV43_RR17365 [Rhamnella rubrinervis]|uniref:Thioredoxin-like protein AAED1, chloroplastic n=1 Tax=Rhamnella rubrinervis TaxID=2594499 RepID=A0A8K0GXV3_9ROSA|nr:hypothetical protein FNV43_RR17365 [Rhamnella rubrinervis]